MRSKDKRRKVFAYISNLRSLLFRHDILLASLLGILLISFATFLGYSNNKVVPLNPDSHARYVLEPNNPLKILSNWDGPDYLNISLNGYQTRSQTNLFPGYPLSARFIHIMVPSLLDSGLIVSWLCLIGSIFFLIKIIKTRYKFKDSLSGINAVLLFILFPTGIFLVASYSEPMLALLILAAWNYANKNKYLLSGTLIGIATVTHITGLFGLLLVLMILYRNKISKNKLLTTFILGMIGLISYMIFLNKKFGDALAFIYSQQHLGWFHWSLSHYIADMGWLNVLMILLVTVSVIYWWNRDKILSLYSLLFLLLPLVGGQFGGYNRYVLMDFALPLMFFDKFKDNKNAYPIILAASSILWAYFLFQYTGGYVGG